MENAKSSCIAWGTERTMAQSSQRRCPQCDAEIPFEAINIQEGMASCNACENLFRISELNWSHLSREDVLAKTPWGCSLVPWGQSLILNASTRSIPAAIGLTFFCLFWNGIVSVFASHAIAGLWANLIGPLPNWLPIAGGIQQGKPVMNGAPMPLGTTLGLCLFLIPFVTIGTGLLIGAMLTVFGRVRVVIDQMDSYVSTGIGFLTWKRRFDPMTIQSVRYFNTRGDAESGPKSSIQLVGDQTIDFASMVPTHRRQWLAAHLQEIFGTDRSLKNSAGRRGSKDRDYSSIGWLDARNHRS